MFSPLIFLVRSKLLTLVLVGFCFCQENLALAKTPAVPQLRPDEGSISGTDTALTPRQASSPSATPQETGSIDSGVYRNSYFGLTYSLPEGWYADTRIFKERLPQGSSDPAKRTFVLFSANEFAPGMPGLKFNPDVVLMADNASAYRHTVITTGKDYLPIVTREMVVSLHNELIQQGAEINIGGHSFYRADYKRPLGYQAVVCTVWKGYVLVWMFVGQTTAQLDELVKSMQSISFQTP